MGRQGLSGAIPISIHAPREGSDARRWCPQYRLPISIHAPREGSDTSAGQAASSAAISIHAPREGSDVLIFFVFFAVLVFLSTLPARGATYYFFCPNRLVWISIHAPREGSDSILLALSESLPISIHAPREGSDEKTFRLLPSDACISIHAPREGSDTRPELGSTLSKHFYPRSPRGERLCCTGCCRFSSRFLSTLPARGAT